MKGLTVRRLAIPLLIALALTGCACPAPFKVPVVSGSDFTFFVAADTHYGQSQWDNNEAGNKANIDCMNTLPGTPYPAEAEAGAVAVRRREGGDQGVMARDAFLELVRKENEA